MSTPLLCTTLTDETGELIVLLEPMAQQGQLSKLSTLTLQDMHVGDPLDLALLEQLSAVGAAIIHLLPYIDAHVYICTQTDKHMFTYPLEQIHTQLPPHLLLRKCLSTNRT